MAPVDAALTKALIFLGLTVTAIALLIIIFVLFYTYNSRFNAWIKELFYKRRNLNRLEADSFLDVKSTIRPGASPIMQCIQPDEKEAYCTNDVAYAKIDKMATLALQKSTSSDSIHSETAEQSSAESVTPHRDPVYAQISFNNSKPPVNDEEDEAAAIPAQLHTVHSDEQQDKKIPVYARISGKSNQRESETGTVQLTVAQNDELDSDDMHQIRFDTESTDFESDMPTKIKMETSPIEEETKMGTLEYNAYHSYANVNETFTDNDNENMRADTTITLPKQVKDDIEDGDYLRLQDSSVMSVSPNSFV